MVTRSNYIIIIVYIIIYKYFAATDGQSCVDMVNVKQPGTALLDANNGQVIIPMSNTSCTGIITGFIVSLSKQQGRNYPRIEIWKPTKSPTQFKMGGNYTLTKHDIIDMTDYHYADVSFAENETINLKRGSFIGIYLPPNPCYTVWSINSTGYSYYTNRRMMNRKNLNITRVLNVYTMVNDSQPLIQIVFGK